MTRNRRPLASRDSGWARAITRRLAMTAITPDQISGLSVVFAVLAGLCLAAAAPTSGMPQVLALLAAAVFVQLRLLCNLLDGMLAIEARRGGPMGAFWNEAPDRVADIAIFVGLGLGAGTLALGWAAASMAILTAYLRAFGQSLGQDADYRGPMAKPHRMAMVTGAGVLAALAAPWILPETVLAVALWVIVAGAVVTALRRGWRVRELLRNG